MQHVVFRQGSDCISPGYDPCHFRVLVVLPLAVFRALTVGLLLGSTPFTPPFYEYISAHVFRFRLPPSRTTRPYNFHSRQRRGLQAKQLSCRDAEG